MVQSDFERQLIDGKKKEENKRNFIKGLIYGGSGVGDNIRHQHSSPTFVTKIRYNNITLVGPCLGFSFHFCVIRKSPKILN